MTDRDQNLQRYIALFNNLPISLNDKTFEQLTSINIRFIDPFNDVCGHARVRNLLQDFAQQVTAPTFTIKHIAWSNNCCFLRWDFYGVLPRLGDWTFAGVSEIHFDDDNRIFLHQDHWDAAENFYQRLPILGTVLRAIRRRLSH